MLQPETAFTAPGRPCPDRAGARISGKTALKVIASSIRKGNVIEQWDHFTEDQLASRVQETCGISDVEPERELSDWQQRLSEINRAVLR